MNRMSVVHVSFCLTLMTHFVMYTELHILQQLHSVITLANLDVSAFAVFQQSHRKVVAREGNDSGQLQQHPSDSTVPVRNGEFTHQFREP